MYYLKNDTDGVRLFYRIDGKPVIFKTKEDFEKYSGKKYLAYDYELADIKTDALIEELIRQKMVRFIGE